MTEDNLPVNPARGPVLLVHEKAWRAVVPDIETLLQRLYYMVQRFGTAYFAVPPSIVLSDNRYVKKLNAEFRGRNKPTNVLTFEPLSPFDGGEIILAFGVVKHEAGESGKTIRAHLAHLLVHGLLHLKGYDHHRAGDARKMEKSETRILRASGFADPWRCGREKQCSPHGSQKEKW